MPISVSIIGCSSATSAHGRHPSAQLVETGGQAFLVDCGEGTFSRMLQFELPFMRVQRIFISHLHGDHIFGLPGYLTTLSLYGRTQEMEVYAPAGLEGYLEQSLRFSHSHLKYPIRHHVLERAEAEILYEDGQCSVAAFPLLHRIPTYGFRFESKPKRPNLKKELIEQLGLTIPDIRHILEGNGHWSEGEGRLYSFEELTYETDPGTSYAYVSDTAPFAELSSYLQGVEHLYHESTYQEDHRAEAQESKHSTAIQAASLARAAGVKRLILGHYSRRYASLEGFVREAREIFPETELATEGKKFFC